MFLVRWLHRFEDGLLAGLLLGMLALALYQIVSRNLFGSGLLWGDGAVRYLVLWLTFLGALAATRRNDHIRIDLVGRLLPTPLIALTGRVAALGAALVCAVFAWHSGRFIVDEYTYGSTAFGAVPTWIAGAIMPAASGLMAVRFLLHVAVPPAPPEHDA